MIEKAPDTLTDKELLEEAKALKSFSIYTAFMVGFLVGILLFGLFYNAWGLFMLIPLFLIYQFTKDHKAVRAAAVRRLIKDRGLKI